MTAPAFRNSDIEPLAEMSRWLGARVTYVQGGGGNTSIKDSAGTMWIKASGTELSSAQAESSFVPVAYERIRSGLASCRNEKDYTSLVAAALTASGGKHSGRPSIETGFHALLPPAVVLHSHSILANLLTCAQEGEELTRALFADAIWVPYASPGLPLTLQVEERLRCCTRNRASLVLMLENHGVVVAAATTSAAWELHELVNSVISEYFSLAEPLMENIPRQYLSDSSNLLFPDQAVYLSNDDLRYTKAGVETQMAYNFLRFTILDKGLQPRFLPQSEAGFLLSMESEKYRQKVSVS